jgi:hypothetical protein
MDWNCRYSYSNLAQGAGLGGPEENFILKQVPLRREFMRLATADLSDANFSPNSRPFSLAFTEQGNRSL